MYKLKWHPIAFERIFITTPDKVYITYKQYFSRIENFNATSMMFTWKNYIYAFNTLNKKSLVPPCTLNASILKQMRFTLRVTGGKYKKKNLFFAFCL